MATEDNEHGIGHILQSLAANLAIAIAKGIAAFFTGSGALLAETLHSFADCANQLLLLVGVRHAKQPPSDDHPFGHAAALYFWSFLVALLLFSGGGLFSVYEGVHHWQHPEPVERPWVGFAILGFSLALEGWSTWGNIRDIRARKGPRTFWRYLRESKDSDLIVVFGENSAAVAGLLFAAISLGLAVVTGDGRWDAAGSVAIGLVLIGVAIFLAIEIASLLIGERADAELHAAVEHAASTDPRIRKAYRIQSVQRGPGEALVALKIELDPNLTTTEIVLLINAFEARVRSQRPDCRWLFVEPDVAPQAMNG